MVIVGDGDGDTKSRFPSLNVTRTVDEKNSIRKILQMKVIRKVLSIKFSENHTSRVLSINLSTKSCQVNYHLSVREPVRKKYGIFWEFFPYGGGGSHQIPKLL